MPRAKKPLDPSSDNLSAQVPSTTDPAILDALRGLGAVFSDAIQKNRPVEKKTASNRVPNTPYTPKDGSPKLKLKRKCHQHGIPLDPDLLTNEQIALFNKLKPGRFLDNWVLVTRRKDRGMDITYPVKTASQRMKLSSQFGISGPNGLNVLLQRCIDEAANPRPDTSFDDEE